MKTWKKLLTLALSAALATSVGLFAASCGDSSDDEGATPADTNPGGDEQQKQTYTVTFSLGKCGDTNYAGTTALPTEGAKEQGAKFNLPAAPVWTGYTFKGWSDGTTVYEAGAQFTMPAANVTLTATWEAQPPAGPTELTPASGTGTQTDPYILNAFEGTLNIKLPACTDESNEYAYVKITAPESGIFQASYASPSGLDFNLTEEGVAAGANAVAIWALKNESYPFPVEAGKTYNLRLCGGSNSEVDLSITFEKIELSIPSTYTGEWMDAEEDPTYTLEVGANNSVKINGTAVTELNLAKYNGGFTFKWDNKDCTMIYVPTGAGNPKPCVMCDIGDEDVVLYKEGNFPAIGSLERPEEIEQSQFAKQYDIPFGVEGEYYLTVTATETQTYTLTTTTDWLIFEMTDSDGMDVFSFDAQSSKDQVFELEEGETYVIMITGATVSTDQTPKAVSFTITEGGDLVQGESIPDILVGEWATTMLGNKTSLTLTEKTFALSLDKGMQLNFNGTFVSVTGDENSDTIVLVGETQSGTGYTFTYTKETGVITYVSGDTEYSLVKANVPSDLPAAWKNAWLFVPGDDDYENPMYFIDLTGKLIVFADGSLEDSWLVDVADVTFANGTLSFNEKVDGATLASFKLKMDGTNLKMWADAETTEETLITFEPSVVSSLPSGLTGTYVFAEGTDDEQTINFNWRFVTWNMSSMPMGGVITGAGYGEEGLEITVNFANVGELTLTYDGNADTISVVVPYGTDKPAVFEKQKGGGTGDVGTVEYPDELNGTWHGQEVTVHATADLTLNLGETITLVYDDGLGTSGTYTATVVNWNDATKTLTLHVLDDWEEDWDFVWNEEKNTFYTTYGYNEITLTKQGGGDVTVDLPEELIGTQWTMVEEAEERTSYTFLTIHSAGAVDVTSDSSFGNGMSGKVKSYDADTGILVLDFDGSEATLTYSSGLQQMTLLLGADADPWVFAKLVIPETLTGEFASVASVGFDGGFAKMEFGVGGDASAVQLTQPTVSGTDEVYVGNVVSVEKHEGGVDGSVVSYTVLVVLNSTGEEEDITQQVFEFDFTSAGVLQVYEDRGGDYLEVVMAFYHVLDEMPEAFYGNWAAQIDGNEVTIVIDEQGATFDGYFTDPEVLMITPQFFIITDEADNPMAHQYTFEYSASYECFTTNAGEQGDEVKFYKEGSKNAPFKWSSVAGSHDVELPDPDLNLPVYIEFTADKDAIYLVSYDNAFKDMQFTLTEKASGTRVASWSVKTRPADAPDGIYPFPLKNGTTYTLKLLNGNAAGTLSITFTETTDIPADYHGTWTDKAENPTYTVTVEANKITVNSNEITTYTVGNADSGWTFTWDSKACSIKYIQQLSAGTETYKEHLEFVVDGGKAVSLYHEGDHPAVAAVGSLKNPEFVAQDALANSYSKDVASGAKYYYAVEATENALYQLTTTVDNLKITIANLEDDGNYAVGDQKIVNLADTTATKSVYFELAAGTTYVIVVENADAATSATVSFAIATVGDDAEDSTLVPAALRTTFVGKTDKALTFTFTALTWQAYTPAVLSGMAPTKWTGSVKSVVDSDASTVISLVAASTGSEFSATYDKTAKELTFTYSGGKTVVYASESASGSVEAWDGELPTIWAGTWKSQDFGAPKANLVVIDGNTITITIDGMDDVDNLTVVITDYDESGMVISFSSEDGSVTGTIERQFTWDTEEITCIKITVNGQLRQNLRPQA